MFKKNLRMKWVGAAMAASIVAAPMFSCLADMTLIGAGSTFGYPIYSKWFDEYKKIHPDVTINYQSIGSGGGIKEFTDGTVDFGATDGPMSDEQLSKVGGTTYHIPTVLGGVVPMYNVKGVGELKFTGQILADIYLGKITKWNDPAIAAVNPGAALPDVQITPVHRSDGSGTTYCFTDYLSKVSSEWKEKVGKGTAVTWPVGLGGKGSEGVSGVIGQTDGAIGYVELIYALQNHLGYGSVQNQAGKFLKADLQSVSAAAAAAARNMPKDYRVSITNAPGENAYPISTFTWLIVHQKNGENKGQVIKDVIEWALSKGEAMAPTLGYAPLPASVKTMIAKTIKSIQ